MENRVKSQLHEVYALRLKLQRTLNIGLQLVVFLTQREDKTTFYIFWGHRYK